MESMAATISDRLAELEQLHAAADAKIEQLLELIEHVDGDDRGAAVHTLPVAKEKLLQAA